SREASVCGLSFWSAPASKASTALLIGVPRLRGSSADGRLKAELRNDPKRRRRFARTPQFKLISFSAFASLFVSAQSQILNWKGQLQVMAQDVFVLGGKRTPMGEYVGALKDISAIELGRSEEHV